MSTRSIFQRSVEPIDRYLKQVGIEGALDSRSKKLKDLAKKRTKSYGISSVIEEINRTRARRENKSSLYT